MENDNDQMDHETPLSQIFRGYTNTRIIENDVVIHEIPEAFFTLSLNVMVL